MKTNSVSLNMKLFTLIVSFLVFTFSSTISSRALDWTAIAQAIRDNVNVDLEAGATYTAGAPTFSTTTGNSVYFEFYTGDLNGNGASIIGLTAPLFEQLGSISDGATVSNLNLVTEESSGVGGKGVLADQSIDALISQVEVSGKLNSVGSDFAGGIVGNAFDTTIIDSSSNIEIIGVDNVGGLVGEATGSTSITNSTASGEVIGQNYVGGLVGSASIDTTISDSISFNDVDGNQYIGGIIGYQNGGIVNNTSSYGDISGAESVGGISGYMEGEIASSRARGSVTGNVTGQAAGGIVGESYGTIDSSSFIGNLEGGNFVGGIAGVSYDEISNSYFSGTLTGVEYVGGIAGYAEATSISNSYAQGDINGEDYVGGISGWLNTMNLSSAYFVGNVIGSDSTIGGIAGLGSGGVIENVYSAGTVSGFAVVGGILGQSESEILIQNVFSTSDITVQYGIAGGLVGASYDSTINNAISKMTITATSPLLEIGGALGIAVDSEITNVQFEGDILGDDDARDLIGSSFNSTINNSPSEGSIQPTSVLNDFEAAYMESNTWASCVSINNSQPYLISFYQSDPCGAPRGIVNFSNRNLVLKSSFDFRSSFGFQISDSPLTNTNIKFLNKFETGQEFGNNWEADFQLNSQKSLELRKGDYLQLQLFFEPEKKVELWLQDVVGISTRIGEIQFDSRGIVVLPPMEFPNAGIFNLFFVENGSKESGEPNRIGEIRVSISE